MQSIQCNVYSAKVQCRVYSVKCTAQSIQRKVYNAKCTVKNTLCKVHNSNVIVHFYFKHSSLFSIKFRLPNISKLASVFVGIVHPTGGVARNHLGPGLVVSTVLTFQIGRKKWHAR